MSYEGIFLHAVALELNKILIGARIDKIYQPNKAEIVLHLRQPGHNFKLMLSASVQRNGVYLTSDNIANPNSPAPFCMLLRKHLEGGRINCFIQQTLERVLEISCDVIDEFGDNTTRKLIVEIMGKHSNIILVDQNDLIFDSIFRIPSSVSSYRQILPGLAYKSPPSQNKYLPYGIPWELFSEIIMSHPLTQTIHKTLLISILGLGPQTVKEILYRSEIPPDLSLEYCGEYELMKIWHSLSAIGETITKGTFEPEIIFDGNVPLAFAAIPLKHFSNFLHKSYASANEAADSFYSHKRESGVLTHNKNTLSQIIKKEMERCERKSALYQSSIQEAQNIDHFKLWGELLTAYLYSITSAPYVEIANFYSPHGKIERIPLDENLSVLENAQNYFRLYRKARSAAQKSTELLEENKIELEYLSGLCVFLDNASTLEELNEIRLELVEEGYLKNIPVKENKKKTPAIKSSVPHKYVLEGWEIYLGKNNLQNDYLVTKIAKSEDLWFHSKDIPGSHVLIKKKGNEQPPFHILEHAAHLAAYHSKARYSSNVPVDYTLRKYVWKQKGAKPGMVNYEKQQTIFVTPDSSRLD